MHFKRLELQGFKSFVDYTCLDFEPGVTAIVGPNGCGKSNVVDSLRWVLGEQSAKALRGSRMEDVIFNGTDQRKAVGMAEVSLTLDNHDHQLPTDLSEITVTRRTFRSGESEYLLNKSVCRLRDIQDLFMDTGIGTNAYSILEQGKIDLIVSSRPADRRFVLEEAAGISKYKSRKEESLRKLEATEQNFLRINDIAVEVRRQIGSLERQVQKARRYQELKQALTTLEVTQGKRELLERRRALRNVEHHWEERQCQMDETEHQKQKQAAELQALAQELLGVESIVGQRQNQIHALTEEIIKAEDFVASSALRQQDLNLGLERMQLEISELSSKAEQIQQQHQATLAQQQKKADDLLQVQTELNQQATRLVVLEQELKTRAAHIQEQQGSLLKNVDQMSGLRSLLKNLENRRLEHEQQIAKLNQRFSLLVEQAQETAEEKASGETDLQTIHTALEKLRNERETFLQNKEHLENTLQALNAMLENYAKTLTQLTSRLAWIEELKNGLDGYELGAKTILLEYNIQPEKFPELIGPLANFIRTEPQYEFAFEAFLGHQLQYLLVQTAAQAQAAMAFLAENNRGRATFIPLEFYTGERIQPSGLSLPEAWMKQTGFLGWAKELAKIDERFVGVFDRLLEKVAIMRDRAAIKNARALGARSTMVTLAGEINTTEGWLTGGSPDIMERGLLGRERELEELKAEKSLLEEKWLETQQTAEQNKLQLMETLAGLEKNNQHLHELEIKAAQLTQALEGVNVQITEIQKQLFSLKNEREQIENALQSNLQEHKQTAEKLNVLEVLDYQTQEELACQQAELEEKRTEYDLRASRVNELKVNLAALEQQQNALRSEGDRMREELDGLFQRKNEKNQLRLQDQARLTELARQREDKKIQLQQQMEQKYALAQKLDEQRQTHKLLLEKKKQLEDLVRNLQSHLDEGREVLHRLDLEKTQLKMNLRSQETYLEEEYRLNLSEEIMPETAAATPGETEMDPAQVYEKIKELKNKLNSLGSVNLVAMEEYAELQQRYSFLSQQLEDLKQARENLQKLITRINQESQSRFAETFTQAREKFREVFRRLFNGGDADLILVDEAHLLETGIEIIARPPGKRLQNISLLSGGEKALTAIALLFAIFLIKPSPFCIFDEMDAPLDDINTMRFCKILQEFAKKSQFIIITHNKITMESAAILYGVTMQESGVSKLISVKLKGQAEKPIESAPPRLAEPVMMS